jgi:hypothetical protein
MPGNSARFLRPLLAAGLFGLVMSPACAQGYDPYGNETPYSSGPNETVTVIGPRFKADSTPLNGPLERVSLKTDPLYDPRSPRSAAGAGAALAGVARSP